ncbi:MAG: hypothetical protein AABY22_15540 [Nanoarchaeota archaeon]
MDRAEKKLDQPEIYIENYIYKHYQTQEYLSFTLEELRKKFFKHLNSMEVYIILKMASEKLRMLSGGKCNFRYDKWFGVWRFFKGKNDSLQLLHQDQVLINGHIKTGNEDFNMLTNLNNDIQEHIQLNDVQIVGVSEIVIKELKTIKKVENETSIYIPQ